MSEEKKEPKSFKDYESYAVNPSALPNEIVGLFIGGEDEVVHRTTLDAGEVIGEESGIKRVSRVVDRHTFTKLFSPSYKEIVNLSSSGISVLSYVLVSLKRGDDKVYIDPRGFDEFYTALPGFEERDSRMVYYRGILDLLKHKFLYRKTGEFWYFININKLFNGERLDFEWIRDIQRRIDNREFVSQKEVTHKDYVAKPKKIK